MPNFNIAITFDAKYEAFTILHEHTVAYMNSVHAEFDTNEDMYERVTSECAFILTTRFTEGEYHPMQYNAVRNELASLLWELFGDSVDAEYKTKLNLL